MIKSGNLRGYKIMKIAALVVALALSWCLSSDASAGEKRYVVKTNSPVGVIDSYTLWSSRQWYDACIAAKRAALQSGVRTVEELERHPQVQRACDTGAGGIKPMVGGVTVGDQVELLDSRDCAPMVWVRVLTGKIKGETGCVTADALSSFKP